MPSINPTLVLYLIIGVVTILGNVECGLRLVPWFREFHVNNDPPKCNFTYEEVCEIARNRCCNIADSEFMRMVRHLDPMGWILITCVIGGSFFLIIKKIVKTVIKNKKKNNNNNAGELDLMVPFYEAGNAAPR